jgi:hypothetical protein
MQKTNLHNILLSAKSALYFVVATTTTFGTTL